MNLPNLNLEMCNAAESMEWGEGVTVVSTLESVKVKQRYHYCALYCTADILKIKLTIHFDHN